jgi:hypothetical protein
LWLRDSGGDDSGSKRPPASAAASQGSGWAFRGSWLRDYEADLQRRTGRDMAPLRKRPKPKARETRPRSASMPPLVLSVYNERRGLARHTLRRARRFGHVRSPASTNVGETYTDASDEEHCEQGRVGDLKLLSTAGMISVMQKNRDVTTAITSILKDRRVFRTEKHGFIGIAHDCVRNGDVAVLVAGASTPFVLRPVEDADEERGGERGEKKYALVGSAYVHGIMYGELMEPSPLRAKFERMVLV